MSDPRIWLTFLDLVAYQEEADLLRELLTPIAMPTELVSELKSQVKGSVILLSGVILLGIAVWLVVSLATCLLIGRTTRLGNRDERVCKNSEKTQTGDTLVVDLDAFRANREAATRRTS